MNECYRVQEGSYTAHCCFEASVMDTQREGVSALVLPVFECFSVEDAERIACALNLLEDETK